MRGILQKITSTYPLVQTYENLLNAFGFICCQISKLCCTWKNQKGSEGITSKNSLDEVLGFEFFILKKEKGISAFYRDVRKTEKGVHVGFVCDAGTLTSARIRLYDMIVMRRKFVPDGLAHEIFRSDV